MKVTTWFGILIAGTICWQYGQLTGKKWLSLIGAIIMLLDTLILFL